MSARAFRVWPGSFVRFFQSDGRHFQIAYLGLFLVYGVFFLHWDADVGRYGVLLGTCLGAQAVGTAVVGGDFRSLKSGLITSLGLSLLCKASAPWVLVLAGVVGIGSKFLLRYRGKHFLNPANAGIVGAIVLTGGGPWGGGEAWVSPGQWGSEAVLLFVIGAAGSLTVLRVGRLDTSVVFLGTFAGLMLGWNVLWLGWPLDFWVHQLTNGSLMLFTFFMVTDPASTPSGRVGRVLWAAGVGCAAFWLSTRMQVYAAPIWALFFGSLLTPLVDRLWPGAAFRW